MFFERELTIYNVAQVATHIKVKLWVVRVYCGQIGIYTNCCTEFFPDLPNQGILWRFFWFDFPSGELPIIFPVAIPALGCKDLIPIADDRRGDVYCIHIVLYGFLLQSSSVISTGCSRIESILNERGPGPLSAEEIHGLDQNGNPSCNHGAEEESDDPQIEGIGEQKA